VIKNLTPHEIVILPEKGGKIVIPSSGVARAGALEDKLISSVEVGGTTVPMWGTEMESRVEGLPDPKFNVWLIVSYQTYRAARGRNDLIVPHNSVRDDSGRIIGHRGFARPR
jgi:hypothetical protein